MTVRIAATPEEAAADYDMVFHDEGGPGEEDGMPWAFAPEDSGICWRFATQEEAVAFAEEWIANRALHNDGPGSGSGG